MPTTRERLARFLPAFALEVRTPRLTLRVPDDDDLVDLAELGAAGVHDDDLMPFSISWTRIPPPFMQRNTLQYFWSQRLTYQQDLWNLPLVAVVDGRIVGTQGAFAKEWPVTRTVETGSWLGRGYQGQGFGKEMRFAVLHLVFDGFGAHEALTAAFEDNGPSLGVTRSLGYRERYTERVAREGEVVGQRWFTMSPDDFATIRRDDIEVRGADEVVALFGTAREPAGRARVDGR